MSVIRVDLEATPKIPFGDWEVVHHGGTGKVDLEIERIGFWTGEIPWGPGLPEWLMSISALNANVLDKLLALPSHHFLPREWREHCPCFVNTVYGSFGKFFVRCLSFSGQNWTGGFRSLDNDFRVSRPIAIYQ